MRSAPLRDSHLGRVLKNAGLLLGGRSVNAALSLAYLALAARSLGVAEFGVLVLINTVAQFISEVVRFQSWQVILQFGAAPLAHGQRADFQRVVRFGLVLDGVSALAGLVVGVLGVVLIGPHVGITEAMQSPAAIYALTILVLAPASHVGLLRLFDRFAVLSAQAAIGSLVRLAGAAVGFALDAPVSFFLLVWAAGSLAAFAYVALAALSELRRRGLAAGFSWSGPLTEGMPRAWRFAFATNASSSLDVAFTHVATLMVGAVAGAADAGLWRVARQIADAIAKPARLLIPALYPELAQLRTAGRPEGMQRLALRVGLLGGGFATILLLVVLFAGEPLLRLIMGPAFAAAAATMNWQVAAAVIAVWALPLEPMLVSLGRPGAVLQVRLVVAAVFLAVMPAILRRHGLEGGGAVLMGASAAMGLGMLWSLRLALRAPAPR